MWNSVSGARYGSKNNLVENMQWEKIDDSVSTGRPETSPVMQCRDVTGSASPSLQTTTKTTIRGEQNGRVKDCER